jgi:alpha-amylase
MKYLLFGTHNHQPRGNFTHVLEYAYEKSYKPFIETLSRCPDFKAVIHFTGELLDWIEQKDNSFIEKLSLLIKHNQVEILSGGFFEPILPCIPSCDRISQLSMLNNRIKELFGISPKGAWIAERVWNSEIAADLVKCGIKYVFLDDFQFEYSGCNSSSIVRIQSQQGAQLVVIPISQSLRYSILNEPPKKVTELIENFPGNFVVFMDDGERFGMWGSSYTYCYSEKYLMNLFNMISENPNIKPVLANELVELLPSSDGEIQPSSYPEMMIWSMDTDLRTRFENSLVDIKTLKSHSVEWTNFIKKYPLVNVLYSKMLMISHEYDSNCLHGTDEYRSLLAAQANDAYWHGMFGGCYLPNLRDALFSAVIKAESALSDSSRMISSYRGKFFYVKYSELSVMADPDDGGKIVDLSYLPSCFCLSNVLTRQEEAYHKKMKQINPDLNNKIVLDWYNKGLFIDHFPASEKDAHSWQTNDIREKGDFANQPYELTCAEKSFTLERTGHVWVNSDWPEVKIRKGFCISKNQLCADYSISSEYEFETDFSVEINMNFLAQDSPDRFITINEENFPVNLKGKFSTDNLLITDLYKKVKVRLQGSSDNVILFPLYTFSCSDLGNDTIYQGSSIVFTKKIKISSKVTNLSYFIDFL